MDPVSVKPHPAAIADLLPAAVRGEKSAGGRHTGKTNPGKL